MTSDPFALPAFVLSIIGLVVAVIGAFTGIVSLVWQIVTRTRGAHRVVVRARSDLYLTAADGSDTADMGIDPGPYLAIEVSNRGAAAVQIRQWMVMLPDGNGLMIANPLAYPPSTPLPNLLEAGTSATFYSLLSALVEAAGARSLSKARVEVQLATGQRVKGKAGEIRPKASEGAEAAQKPEASGVC